MDQPDDWNGVARENHLDAPGPVRGPADGSDVDLRLTEELRAWSAAHEGAAARRRISELGALLHEAIADARPPDAGEVIARASEAVTDLLTRHPVGVEPERSIEFVDVFSGRDDPALEVWRAESLDVLARGAVAPAAQGGDEALVDALLHTAFGLDGASSVLRDILLGKPAPDSEGLGRPLSIPSIPWNRLRQLVVWGTIREVLQSLRAHGNAWRLYADWVARARSHGNGIAEPDPGKGCACDEVVIRGSGFGGQRPAHTTVRFPTQSGSCANARVVSWSEEEITVIVPDNVGIGCVGFLVTDGPPPTDPVGAHTEIVAAAGMLQSVLGDEFGAAGVMFGQGVVETVAGISTPRLPCPPCLPIVGGKTANRFIGGPPVIRVFTVNGMHSVRVNPGGQLTLAWDVEGADAVTIVTRMASSSRWPAALPPVPATEPLAAKETAGPFPVTYDGADDWDGEYTLSATNPCSAEPVLATVRVEMRELPPLMGLADTHVHFLSNLAFAGYGVFGPPHASDPSMTGDTALADALPWCSGHRGHGPGGVLPSLEGGEHLVGGYPEFNGWPRHTTLAHQHAYVDWIKRAVDGGLRLVVFLAVNNELLARRMTELYGAYLPQDDASAITRQLDAIRGMVDFLNAQANPRQGWMEIAETPADARRIVASGRLAVVLGVEVDSLGGWRTPQALEADAQAQARTPRQLIAAALQDLYDKGVRHVFPVHVTNNAFGGPALFVREYDAANYFVTGESFEVEAADPSLGVAYRIDEDDFQGGAIGEILAYHGVAAARGVFGAALTGLSLGGMIGAPATGAVAGAAVGVAQYPTPPRPTNWAATPGGHINARGLTQYGEILIEEMMRRGMIIDIDHMGHKTTERVLVKCEARSYPVVSGHTGFRELKYGYDAAHGNPRARYTKDTAELFGTLNVKRLSSEVDKTPQQLERIRRLGGFVSTFLHQRDVRDCGCGAGRVANDSSGSVKSFAQAFLYAHVAMHGRRVGFGSDINGAGQLPGPRFGPQASADIRDERDWEVRRRVGLPLRRDQVFTQRDGVRYTTAIEDYRHHRFMDYAGDPPQAPFDKDQRDFWEAIAIWRSGTPPETADQPIRLQRRYTTQNFIINLATGLRAGSRADLPIPIPFPLSTKPWPFFNVNHAEQLAAYLASHPGDTFLSSDPQRTRDLVGKLQRVWDHWQAMERGTPTQGTDQWTQQRFGPSGSGLYDTNGSLVRSKAGRRDFDINIDGMAHYGMLPDLMQDLRNVGVQAQDIAALYRAAEDYIRVWERCEARKLP